ncbi:FAD binding domain of DNA photolyase-domain-containing protein, partial [Baffinella frigidus]
MAAKAGNTVYWFRKALRLHDNPSLVSAIKASKTFHPVFCVDPKFGQSDKVGANRMSFLLETLEELDASLRAMDSRLIVLHGDPCVELPKVWDEWGVSHLCFEKDTEPYSIQRDAAITDLATKKGITVHTDPPAFSSGTLFAMSTIFFLLSGLELSEPSCPVSRVPPPATRSSLYRVLARIRVFYWENDLSYDPTVGTPRDLELLTGDTEEISSRTQWVAKFEKPKSAPTVFDPEERSTTVSRPSIHVLSPYVTFGCLSSRVFWHELMAVYARGDGKHSQPPVSLEGQLLWREFYYASALQTPHFDKMEGNTICRQIPWAEDEAAQVRFEAWRDAKTGFPWIDACMIQLKQEGHIHHLARHALACFLTRGDLWVSWERGAKVFDELLLDADFALNNGNWMWLSASCYFYQYFRCYSPVAFGKHTDPDGTFIKHYLPVLKDMPSKYVFEPWKAPLEVQKKAGCVVGTDYPKPIVQHEIVSKENMGKMSKAYEAHK